MVETLKKVGEWLEWSSGAAGTTTRKQGKIIAIVPAKESLDAALKKLGREPSASGVKGQDRSLSDRYLVEVDRGGKLAPHFYAPLVKVIDNALKKARKGKETRSYSARS